jgi:hypothetical protein
MRIIRITIVTALAFAIVSTMLLTSLTSAQKKAGLNPPFMIQAQAMGTSTQLGRNVSVDLRIKEFSTAQDQKVLLEAFNQKQNEGLVNALSKMHSKGRISITGTLGYDVNYIRKFNMPDGSTKIRLVTDRAILFGEVWSSTRSMDYSLAGGEILISKDGKHNSGMLAPACQFKIDKENQLRLELYQNEWKLVNIRIR